MNKRGAIVLLIGLNVLLLGAIAFTVYTPPSAFAQAMGGRQGECLLFSARAEVLNDAIYMLDASNHKLHVFRSAFPRNPTTGATTVGYFSTRDLARDFAAAPGAVKPAPGAQPNVGQGQGGQP